MPKIGTSPFEVFNVIKHGEIAGSATAKQLPDIPCCMVRFSAPNGNVSDVYIGGAGVTVPEGTQDITSGLELMPGDHSGWLLISNLNLLYIICDAAGDDLSYLALI